MKLPQDWRIELHDTLQQPYIKEIWDFLNKEIKSGATIYPPQSMVFNAYNKTPFKEVKVCLLSQDPYHGEGQANGLAFSVSNGVPKPPSLENIFIELKNDLGIPIPEHGNLEKWAEQGVFLLNSVLTVRAGVPNSHKGRGWEQFTDATIKAISDGREGVIFLLLGKQAQEKISLIDVKKHHVLTSSHPSPYSVDKHFFGCKHFSYINKLLTIS